MEHPIYTALKVNNEIELCEISDMDCKRMIEKRLLQERISYYIHWLKPTLFGRRKNVCIICVNENVREKAEEITRSVCDEKGYPVRFLFKRMPNQYL
ncbi:MAG: hypothetical protein HFG25_05745 [Lachnospiraceae bacterium]|jgi:hypothetical protein|nr:hypothetical protein [Lachnospiraceae bacterium]